METNWEDKSTNEILIEIKQMEFDYEALKTKMLKDFDALVLIEQKFKDAHDVINKRLKK
jgi:hypothetical protein